eukprot:jgi/Psemu1/1034/gm1.1034_g
MRAYTTHSSHLGSVQQGNNKDRLKSASHDALVPVTPPDNDSQAAATKAHDGPPPAKKRHQFLLPSKVALPVFPKKIFLKQLPQNLMLVHQNQTCDKIKKTRKSQLSSKVAPSVTPQVLLPEAAATKLDDSVTKTSSKEDMTFIKGRTSVTPQAVFPVQDARNLDAGSLKPKKGQNGVQGGSAEGKNKGKLESRSEVLQYIPGGDLHPVAPSTLVGYVPGSLFPSSPSTPQEHVPQAAAIKAHGVPQRAKNRHQLASPPKCAVSVRPQQGSPCSPSITEGASVPITIQEDVDCQEYLNSVKNNLQLALHGQLYASTEFVKASSSDVTRTSFSQLMTKVYIVSKIIQLKPMPNFHKMSSMTSDCTAKKKKKKKKSLSSLGPIPRKIDVMVNLFLFKTDNGFTGKLAVLGRNEITNQFKEYEMKTKWENFQPLLWYVHGGRQVGDAKPCLYYCNVTNYKTIKKYMVVYREILVWYMENVKYFPAPENKEKGVYFYTKCEHSSLDQSEEYLAVMKQFLDGLIAKSALRVSMSQSCNQNTLDTYLKSKRVECLESLCNNQIEFVPQNESQKFVPNALMNAEKPRDGFFFHFVLNYSEVLTKLYDINKEYISKVLCHSMWAEDITVDDLFENRSKALLEDVMEKTEDLVLKEQRYVR